MDEQTINTLIEEYKFLLNNEKRYREELLKEMEILDDKFNESLNKNIYKLIYKDEYGDYRKFVELLAEKLRNL
jgi:hypothetical protein